VGLVTDRFDPVDDVIDLGFRGIAFHNDDHDVFPPLKKKRPWRILPPRPFQKQKSHGQHRSVHGLVFYDFPLRPPKRWQTCAKYKNS
jgi:hypothetical protein